MYEISGWRIILPEIHYYRPQIISWRFYVQILWLDGVVISQDIAILGYDVDF